MPRQKDFTWLDIFRSIWHFLEKDKAKYVFFNIILFLVFFYELVPALILGKIVDFFTIWRQGDSLKIFYIYCIFLGAAYSLSSLIRLKSKETLTKIGISAKTRAKTIGFERLMGFSLPWHSKENSGSKVQRIFTGSDAISGWIRLLNDDIYYIATSFIGILSIFLFLNPVFLIFLLIYTFLFFAIQYAFNKKLKIINDDLNSSKEKASGAYFEGTTNVLAIKALGVEKDIHARVETNEEIIKKIEFIRSNVGINKWCSFHTLSGFAYTLFILLTGYQFIGGKISLGLILVYFTYFSKIKEAAQKTTQISNDAVELKSNFARMMPIFKEAENIEWGDKKFPKNWRKIKIKNGGFSYPSGQKGIEKWILLSRKTKK